MKATELINKFKQILLSTTDEVKEDAMVEETVELTETNEEVKDVEVQEEEVISNEEVLEEVEETEEEVTEEVIEAEEKVDGNVNEERVIENESSDVQLSDDVSEEVITETEETPELLSEEVIDETVELAEETTEEAPVEEAPVVEAEDNKYASIEELAGLKAEIKALSELLNNLNPKKDVPRELSAEEIENEQVEAEGISVSPEADVVAQTAPIVNNKRTAGPVSQKDIVWGKLFGNN